MKTLELNNMELIEGGQEQGQGDCLSQMGIHALVGGLFGGPWGYVIGAAYGYYMSPEC